MLCWAVGMGRREGDGGGLGLLLLGEKGVEKV